jgi:hypothetical protein
MIAQRSIFRKIPPALSPLRRILKLHSNVSKCNFVFLLVNAAKLAMRLLDAYEVSARLTITGKR